MERIYYIQKKSIILEEAAGWLAEHWSKLCLRHAKIAEEVIMKFFDEIHKEYRNLSDLNLQSLIIIDVAEEELLLRLGRNSIWAARYPVPIGPGALAAMKKFSNGKYYLTAYLGPKDVGRVHDFVDRLRGIVIQEVGVLHNK